MPAETRSRFEGRALWAIGLLASSGPALVILVAVTRLRTSVA
jgi:hypothetical protein